MKTKIKTLLLLLSLITTVMVSCSDDDKESDSLPLSISENRFNVPIDADRYIQIESGNKDYSFIVEDKSILDVKYENATEYHRFGGIRLYGLKKGTTALTVVDNVSKESKELEIRVTARYLLLQMSNMFSNVIIVESNDDPNANSKIMKDILEFALLQPSYYLALMGNVGSEENDKMYIFESYQDADEGNTLHRGTYKIEKEDDIYSISLNIVEDDKTVTHKYTMRNSSTTTFSKAIDFLKGEIRDGICYEFEIGKAIFKEDLLDVYKPSYPLLGEATCTIEAYMSAFEPDLVTIDIKD